METKILGYAIILGGGFLFIKGIYIAMYSDDKNTKKDGEVVSFVAFFFMALGVILLNG